MFSLQPPRHIPTLPRLRLASSTYVRNESASHPIASELLGVAGYPQNNRNNLIGYGSNHMRYDAEIEAHLCTDHWQDEKNAYQDHHPVWF